MIKNPQLYLRRDKSTEAPAVSLSLANEWRLQCEAEAIYWISFGPARNINQDDKSGKKTLASLLKLRHHAGKTLHFGHSSHFMLHLDFEVEHRPFC